MSEKTITLSGSEVEVAFSGGNAWLRNDGASAVYAAKTAGVAAGADGVISIPAGGSAPVYGANGRVYLLGTGSVQLIGSDYSANPFKTSAQAGGSGVDDVARAAIEAHAGNAEIHVTAAEKAAWDGKAEKSDIPTSLPADGGNAETVGGKSADEFVQYIGKITTSEIVDDPNYPIAYECSISPEIAQEIGLSGGWYHLKYFKHPDSGDIGWGAQIVLPLNNSTLKPMYRFARNTSEDWGTWHNFADGGNAASVGAYTEAKLAALEARVAALEGN